MMRKEFNQLRETYTYGKNKDIVSEKEEIKCNNIIKRYKTIQL